MGLILTPEERLARAENENKMLRTENADLKAFIDYNVMMENIEDPTEDEEEMEVE